MNQNMKYLHKELDNKMTIRFKQLFPNEQRMLTTK
jgi:hypothetical protein